MLVPRCEFDCRIGKDESYCYGVDTSDTVQSWDLYQEVWLEEERMTDYSILGYSAVIVCEKGL